MVLWGLLDGLWHGELAHRCLRGIPSWRTIQQSLSNRPLNGPRPVFGTATLPTSTSGASSRGEGKRFVTVAGLMVKFATGFGTAPPATGGSETGPRGEEGFYRHFGTGIPPTSTSVASSRGEASPNQPQTGLSPAFHAGPRHGDSSQKYFRGIPVWRRGASDLPFGTGTLNRTTSEMALRGEGTFSRIRIIKDYRTYFFNSNSGNLERKAICR